LLVDGFVQCELTNFISLVIYSVCLSVVYIIARWIRGRWYLYSGNHAGGLEK